MRCCLLLVVEITLGLTTMAVAKDFTLPSDSPVITVTIPDTWQPQESPVGLIGYTEAPEQTNLALNVVDKSNLAADFLAEVDRLRVLGINLDPSTKESKFDEQVNGMRYVWSLFDTNYEGNPEKYSFGALEISDDLSLEITFLCN